MRPEDLLPAFMKALDDVRERISLPGPVGQSAAGCPVDAVLYVTDHGNATLYAAEPEQPDEPLWEVV